MILLLIYHQPQLCCNTTHILQMIQRQDMYLLILDVLDQCFYNFLIISHLGQLVPPFSINTTPLRYKHFPIGPCNIKGKVKQFSLRSRISQIIHIK